LDDVVINEIINPTSMGVSDLFWKSTSKSLRISHLGFF